MRTEVRHAPAEKTGAEGPFDKTTRTCSTRTSVAAATPARWTAARHWCLRTPTSQRRDFLQRDGV